METEIKRLAAEKTAAVRSQNFEQAAELRDKEKSLQDLLDQEKEKWKNTSSHDVKEVTPADIAAVVSGWTGIPVQQITKEESQRLLQLKRSCTSGSWVRIRPYRRWPAPSVVVVRG